jgi:hypothetical protein
MMVNVVSPSWMASPTRASSAMSSAGSTSALRPRCSSIHRFAGAVTISP